MSTGEVTVRDVTRRFLRQCGMTTVFGNPGTTEIPFLTEWPDDFHYVLGLQESVVVAMADGFAQARRAPAFVNLHSAGGVGHALGSVFTAHRNRAPVIVTAGQQTRTLVQGEPFLGATDAALFPRPYVKWSCEPARAEDVPAALARAYHMAMQPPQGPVFVSIPADDWDQPAAEVPERQSIPGFVPDPDAVAALAGALQSCARPAFVVGAAVDQDGAVPDLVALAEKTQAAVWASPMSGRCSFPEDHALFAGFLPPEQRMLTEALTCYDLVVVWGAPAFTYHVYRGAAETALPPMFLVHDDPDVLARAREGRGILGTMAHSVRQVGAAVAETDRRVPAGYARPEKPAESTPMTAAYVLDVLDAALPVNAAVVEEAPSHRNDLHDFLRIRSQDGGFFATASGALGYAIGAAVGVAMADRGRRTLGLIGDGSAMYGIQAVWTAVREQAPVTFLVMDNSRYAAVAILGEAAGGNKIPGVDLGGIDFVSLAASMGCPARFVQRPQDLKTALAEDFSAATTGPTLLHVRLDRGERAIY
jgi:benzoylformate decarboxylase